MDDLEDPNKVLMDGIDQALVEKICKQSMDHNYCVSVILSDPEGLTNVLYRLGLVITSVSYKLIPTINGEIGNALIKATNPLVRERIKSCQADIDGIIGDFDQARTAAGTQSYVEEAKYLSYAQDKIAACNARFKASPPTASPIASNTYKIETLIGISALILSATTHP
ncbi:uncharacterized protein LOC126727713 [Quercus robur]|uniref:uncharacterized protein LOC126727713 n=1 Tax=Quercus robur TaxID=38942 RepID=UPI002161EC20|nr:uncharacterized protein LOC126727713 [Quercus robur]